MLQYIVFAPPTYCCLHFLNFLSCSTVSLIYIFWNNLEVQNIHYIFLLYGLLLPSKIHLAFLHVFSYIENSIYFRTTQYSIVWMCYLLFGHSSDDRHVGYFYASTTVNEASKNIYVKAFLCILFSVHLSKYQCNYCI